MSSNSTLQSATLQLEEDVLDQLLMSYFTGAVSITATFYDWLLNIPAETTGTYWSEMRLALVHDSEGSTHLVQKAGANKLSVFSSHCSDNPLRLEASEKANFSSDMDLTDKYSFGI
ncbi:hypothetical protein CONPUDRAFT_75172 [Coniophora puteana RWD-64-598 SS2]|uniref:Uncharacterized protein n=1 Tax=Coniophora puteana (strain RWD-64-598) TaxID=741705 RepID=A0A5M3MHD1_CONPW|nr:uncharacterized protein CONPUDRAFT_75172 [Coniophora puteana RWD-64-598 SS2]EIW78513.1 hypothetical protein CONPUDRAFT_75172 [Coniophora puteana RWD-64-598 SS2]